jgi:peptidoglycan/xylan/chitin deacetylase (PgdA/CDA1 family)
MWGETAMRDIAVNLQVAGQDLALHTHPDMAYDPLRSNMYQYSLDEQVAIIRDGVRFLTSWTGRPVVAHRAGNYSADKRTLEALTRNGLRIDSSLFWEHPHCRLIDLGLPRNLPSLRGPLIEIPVTVYQREERPELFDNILAPVTSVRKIDADWFYDKDEAKAAIDGIVEADLPFLVIFLHSFSFIEGQRDGRVPVEDRHTRDIFGAILDRISQRRLKVVTMRDLAASEVVTATSQDQDVLPRVPVHTGLPRYLWHRQRVVGTGTLAIGVVVLFIIGTAVLIAVQRQRLTANAEDDRLGRDSRKVDREGH